RVPAEQPFVMGNGLGQSSESLEHRAEACEPEQAIGIFLGERDQPRHRLVEAPRLQAELDQRAEHELAVLAPLEQLLELAFRAAQAAPRLQVAGILECLRKIRLRGHQPPLPRAGTGTTSKATVVRGRSDSNGTVPCHM